MRGILEQRGEDTWRVRAYAGRQGGKVRWVSRTVTGGKRDAQRALAKLVSEVESGQVAAGHPVSLGELVDRWLDDISPHRAVWTMHKYREVANGSVKPAIGSVRLDKLSARQLDDFYKTLSQRGLSPASVRRQHALLHTALGRAVKWGMIVSNPADRATPPALVRRTVTTPSLPDVQRLIAGAAEDGDPVLATAIALGAVTGARRGELCALRWSDVDWERRLLRIARSLTVIRQQMSEGQTKTHQVRQIAMDDVTGAFLLVRRRQQENYATQVGVALCSDPYLLSRSADGSGPCLPDGLSHGYERLAKRLGIGGHLHELRHFAATTAIAGGADVRTVAGRLGHADPSVTLRVYAHALEARDRELAGMLGSAVLGTVNRGTKPDQADPPAPPELESAG
jgi:integrase